MKTVRGSNQYRSKFRYNKAKAIVYLIILSSGILWASIENWRQDNFIRAVVDVTSNPIVFAAEVENILPTSTPTNTPTPTATPTPKPSELESIVAYITRVFEPEGKAVVVRAINCFYSESGLREKAVGQNTDGPRSKDHGVAQLNDYWHNLSEEEKTEYKANIDRAYKIYKARGNFSAWYGKLCN